jgi:redox-sensitive bicupin YhaK (pirin superfamily)
MLRLSLFKKGEELIVTAGKHPLRMLVFAAKPLREPMLGRAYRHEYQ